MSFTVLCCRLTRLQHCSAWGSMAPVLIFHLISTSPFFSDVITNEMLNNDRRHRAREMIVEIVVQVEWSLSVSQVKSPFLADFFC